MTVTRELTRDQALALTTHLALCRPHGARRWDNAETLSALAKLAHLDLGEVTLAMTRAATDRTCNSPFAVTNTTSPHWRERHGSTNPDVVSPRPRQYAAHQRCGECQDPLDAHWRTDHEPYPDKPHTPVDVSGVVLELRDIVASTRPTQPEEAR